MTNKVIMYGASWCAPCKAVKPVFTAVGSGYLSEMGVEFEYVDVDSNVERASEAGIRSVPSLKLYTDGTFAKDISSRTREKMELEIEHAILVTDQWNPSE
jgi:thioredoxin 1